MRQNYVKLKILYKSSLRLLRTSKSLGFLSLTANDTTNNEADHSDYIANKAFKHIENSAADQRNDVFVC